MHEALPHPASSYDRGALPCPPASSRKLPSCTARGRPARKGPTQLTVCRPVRRMPVPRTPVSRSCLPDRPPQLLHSRKSRSFTHPSVFPYTWVASSLGNLHCPGQAQLCRARCTLPGAQACFGSC